MTVDEAMKFFEEASIGIPQGSDFVGVVLSSGVALSSEVRRLRDDLDEAVRIICELQIEKARLRAMLEPTPDARELVRRPSESEAAHE